MSTDAVVVVENLRKTYGATVAVADVSLTVRRSEIFGILGPNGAGKTTTVECMAGLRPADGGHLRVLGLDPHHHTREVRQRVGVQLQQSRLPARLRVGEALDLYASFYPYPADPAELIDLLGLSRQRRTEFGDLSGGQQQRLSIALALIGNPEIAILDELTTGLDPQARRATWDLIRRVRDRGVTVVLVTHYMDEAEHLCDRLAIINHGTVATTGSPGDLTAPTGEGTYTLRLVGDTGRALTVISAELPGIQARQLADGAIEIAGGPQSLAAALTTLAGHRMAVDAIGTGTRTLEDIFVELAEAP